MNQFKKVGVWLEIRNFLDWVVETIQESGHCLLIVFFDIGSYHCNLHFLEVFFDGLGSLLEDLQFLKEITSVMRGHKTYSHLVLHLIPSCNGWFAFVTPSCLKLFPPYEDVVL